MKDLIYISDSHFPSYNADSIQISSTIKALRLNEVKVRLIALKSPSNSHSEPIGSDSKLLPILPIKGYLYIFGLYSLFYNLLRKRKTVYSRHLFSAVLLSIFGFRTFYEMHNDYWNSTPLPNYWVKKAFRKMTGFISISQGLKNQFLKDFPMMSQENVLVAPDGANINNGKARSCFDLNSSKLNVGYTGSFHKGKGIELVLEMAIKVSDDFHFHIVGGPVPKGYLETTFSNITFHGQAKYSDIPGFLNEIDIAVLPNQKEIITGKKGGSIAGFTSPLKMFDYMAAGKCILSSDMKVLREVLNDKNAYLLPSDNASEWVRILNQINNNRELIKQKGFQAQKDFESKYTWDLRAKSIHDFISK
ncbi:MAG: hypothetical protein COA58_01640 [Bacteroidetes bacterium]|nr:MAG: hypothetical protein COA58_01640 [Bacteroidota bacterium]